MNNFIKFKTDYFLLGCSPLPIYHITHFWVGTKNYIALGGVRFERINDYNIALCIHEYNEIKVKTYFANNHYTDISDMTYYYNGKNDTMLVSACEHQTITIWNIHRKECVNEFQGKSYIWGKINSIDTYFDDYNNSRRIIFGI